MAERAVEADGPDRLVAETFEIRCVVEPDGEDVDLSAIGPDLDFEVLFEPVAEGFQGPGLVEVAEQAKEAAHALAGVAFRKQELPEIKEEVCPR